MDSHNEVDEAKLRFLVKRMEVELTTPEFAFFNVDDDYSEDTCCMYFIQKGDCKVLVKDNVDENTVEVTVRDLYPGDLFGVMYNSLTQLGSFNDIQMQKNCHCQSQQLLFPSKAQCYRI